MAAGSYAISLGDRARLRELDPEMVGPMVLKLIGENGPASFKSLQLGTDVPEDMLKKTLDELLSHALIVLGRDDRYALTERGEKARSVVAS